MASSWIEWEDKQPCLSVTFKAPLAPRLKHWAPFGASLRQQKLSWANPRSKWQQKNPAIKLPFLKISFDFPTSILDMKLYHPLSATLNNFLHPKYNMKHICTDMLVSYNRLQSGQSYTMEYFWQSSSPIKSGFQTPKSPKFQCHGLSGLNNTWQGFTWMDYK